MSTQYESEEATGTVTSHGDCVEGGQSENLNNNQAMILSENSKSIKTKLLCEL